MLTSITPLGERGRGSRWSVTVAFLIAGSLASGAIIGGLSGGIGVLLAGSVSASARLGVIALALAVAIPFELGVGGLHLPSPRRQVNENWMTAYRSWVYGLGFGLQLGSGLVTIITTATVFLFLLAALLAGGIAAGVAIGATFGLVRGLTVLPAGMAKDPEGLLELASGLRRLERPSAVLTLAGMAGALVVSLTVLALGVGG